MVAASGLEPLPPLAVLPDPDERPKNVADTLRKKPSPPVGEATSCADAAPSGTSTARVPKVDDSLCKSPLYPVLLLEEVRPPYRILPCSSDGTGDAATVKTGLLATLLLPDPDPDERPPY